MTVTHITLRRKDGEKLAGMDYVIDSVSGTWLNLEAFDAIQEQWDGDLLVRSRVIRLGANEVCDNPECNGTGKLGSFSPVTQLEYWCADCHGEGVKPRDPNPKWIETNPPFAYWRQMGHDLIDELDDVIEDSLVATDVAKVIYGFLEPRVLAIEADRDKWKQIATQFYDSGEHTNRCTCPVVLNGECSCGWFEAEKAYESALKQGET